MRTNVKILFCKRFCNILGVWWVYFRLTFILMPKTSSNSNNFVINKINCLLKIYNTNTIGNDGFQFLVFILIRLKNYYACFICLFVYLFRNPFYPGNLL